MHAAGVELAARRSGAACACGVSALARGRGTCQTRDTRRSNIAPSARPARSDSALPECDARRSGRRASRRRRPPTPRARRAAVRAGCALRRSRRGRSSSALSASITDVEVGGAGGVGAARRCRRRARRAAGCGRSSTAPGARRCAAPAARRRTRRRDRAVPGAACASLPRRLSAASRIPAWICGIMVATVTAAPTTWAMLPSKPTNGLTSGKYCWRARSSASRAAGSVVRQRRELRTGSTARRRAAAASSAGNGRGGGQRAGRRRAARRAARPTSALSRARCCGSSASRVAQLVPRRAGCATSAASRSCWRMPVCTRAAAVSAPSAQQRELLALQPALLGEQCVVEPGLEHLALQLELGRGEALAGGARVLVGDPPGGHHLGREGEVLHRVEAEGERRAIPALQVLAREQVLEADRDVGVGIAGGDVDALHRRRPGEVGRLEIAVAEEGVAQQVAPVGRRAAAPARRVQRPAGRKRLPGSASAGVLELRRPSAPARSRSSSSAMASARARGRPDGEWLTKDA